MINRTAKYTYGEMDGTDYKRELRNTTDHALRVVDASGRTQILSPIARTQFGKSDGYFTVKEKLLGRDAGSYLDIPKLDPPTGAETWIEIKTAVDACTVLQSTNGMYIEEVGLHVSTVDSRSRTTHPRFSANPFKQLKDKRGAGLSLELLDPNCQYATYYANVGGVVFTVIPQRSPVPSEDCLRLTRWDGRSGDAVTTKTDVMKALTGEGEHGIRLYQTSIDAKADVRNPLVTGKVSELETSIAKSRTDNEKLRELIAKNKANAEQLRVEAAERMVKYEQRAGREKAEAIAARETEARKHEALIATMQHKASLAESRSVEAARVASERAKQDEVKRVEAVAALAEAKRVAADKARQDEVKRAEAVAALAEAKAEHQRRHEAAIKKAEVDYEARLARVTAEQKREAKEAREKFEKERAEIIAAEVAEQVNAVKDRARRELEAERAKRHRAEETLKTTAHAVKKEQWAVVKVALGVVAAAFALWKTFAT